MGFEPATFCMASSRGLLPAAALSRPYGEFDHAGGAAVEREFGRLKNDWVLLPLGVRGLERGSSFTPT